MCDVVRRLGSPEKLLLFLSDEVASLKTVYGMMGGVGSFVASFS